MAEVDPIDPFEPHREGEDDHEGQETELGGHDNEGYEPHSHRLGEGEERQNRQEAMDDLIRNGFKAPPDLYYVRAEAGGEVYYAVSEDDAKWYGIKYGFGKNGEKLIGLIPTDGRGVAPDRLYARLGIENPDQVEESTEGPTEYLKKVFDNPNLDGVSYGTTADGRVWVSLSRTNAVKYFIGEDGTAEDVSGKRVRLPDTLKSLLGKTSVEAIEERDEKVKQNIERGEYLKRLKEIDQVNIELREMNEGLEGERTEKNEELRQKDAIIASQQEKLQKYENELEQVGIDMARFREKEQHYKEVINTLTEQLENALSPTEKARLTTQIQIASRENQANVENINEKQRQLDQAARVVAQQKERITELEMQKQELEGTIEYLQRHVDENNAQVERNESEIGDRDMQQVDQERQELENENEQLEEQNREAFDRLSLREKVKVIFRRYGLTMFGVLAAVGTIIGVIVSNLKAGLQKVATGVGKGLKEIGAKLGQILPGMIGAIASFLFKAAGEAVGFLAKNSWLLILLVVTFAVDQFKAKNGKGK